MHWSLLAYGHASGFALVIGLHRAIRERESPGLTRTFRPDSRRSDQRLHTHTSVFDRSPVPGGNHPACVPCHEQLQSPGTQRKDAQPRLLMAPGPVLGGANVAHRQARVPTAKCDGGNGARARNARRTPKTSTRSDLSRVCNY